MNTKFFYTGTTAAIVALNEAMGNSHQFVVSGEPTNETEYNDNVEWVGLESAPYTWSQVNTKKTELENAEPLRKLREQRDLKFKDEVDPISLKYLSTGQSIPSAWTTYANALRDLPSNYTTSDSQSLSSDLSNLVWPTKPE